MATFYVPYSGKRPAPVSINGHRFLILSSEEQALEGNLPLFGADRLRRVKVGESQAEQSVLINKLARSVECGVVVAPEDVDVREVINGLSAQLPWIH